MKLLHTLMLVAALAAELALFQATAVRRSAWVYPRWNDQAQYLNEDYQAYAKMSEDGPVAGFSQALSNPSPQGMLHGVWALAAFSVAGPTRSAALSVNMLAFLAFQAATFLAVRRMSDSYALAWMSMGLLAALQFPWSGGPGSAIDYRLDWMAACAYGVAIAAAMACDGFRSTRWALVFGAAVGVVVLTRYLAAVYFAVIFPLMLVAALAQGDRWKRSVRVILAGAVALAVAGPALWINRAAIYGYYWIGHVEGPERALRETNLGLVASVQWVFAQVFVQQVGVAAGVLCLAAAGVLLAAGLPWRGCVGVPERKPGPMGEAWVAATIFFAAPALVLSFHTLKAPQAVSIIAPAALWMAILGCMHLARKVNPGVVAVASAMVVLFGGQMFASAVLARPIAEREDADARKVNALVDYIFYRAEECGLERPHLAVTGISDALNGPAFHVLGYERHGVWMEIETTLPTGLFETSAATVMDQLGRSDFVCLLTKVAATPWPFDRQLQSLLPETRAWCDAHLRRVGDVETLGFSASVYERADLARAGGGGAASLSALLASAARAPAGARAEPPAIPILPMPLRVIGSIGVDLRYVLRAAYSPVRYDVTGLPEGLRFDVRTNEFRGRSARPGAFFAKLVAANAAGSATGEIAIQIDTRRTYGTLWAPRNAAAGRPVEIRFEAFDAAGRLDFIDVTDLTTGKPLDRLTADPEDKQTWQGRYRTVLTQQGAHTLLLRFVCYDGSLRQPYSFVDETCIIDVVP